MQMAQWEQAYNSAREELRHYYHVINKGGFRYGYNHFPPFIKTNARPHGPLAELMDDIAKDIDIVADPVRCTWDNFAEKLALEEYATVAVPLMQVHPRSFSIVPICSIHCGTLFFSQSLKRNVVTTIHRNIRAIRLHLSELYKSEPEERDKNSRIEAIDAAIHGIASAGDKSFAAARQYFEYLLLQHLDAPIQEELKEPLAEDAVRAAKDGFLCVIDLVTLRQIEENIGTEAFEKGYHFMPLLGSWFSIPAGLPFKNKHFGSYLYHRLRYNVGGSWSRFASFSDKQVNENKYMSPLPFQIFSWDSVPEDTDLFSYGSPRKNRFLHSLSTIMASSENEFVPFIGTPLLNGQTPAVAQLTDVHRQAMPPRILEFREMLDRIDNVQGGNSLKAIRIAVREIEPAQQYVIHRYQAIIEKKYIDGLTPKDEEELSQVSKVLDDMDVPFYENLIARLRTLSNKAT